MYRNGAPGKRLIELTRAFNSDGFKITKVFTYKGRLGMAAESKTSINYDTGKSKKVFYLEGTTYETGFLLGNLAGDEIESMCHEFVNKIVFAFIGSKLLQKAKLIQKVLTKIIYEYTKKDWEKVPGEIKDEVIGLYDGCKSRKKTTSISMEQLIILNIGIDTICSRVYTGAFLKRIIPDIEPEDFSIPLMCNAFTVGGKSAGHGFYFGRDFTFPTADVFHNTMTMIIYNRKALAGETTIPMVSVTAPGMAGSISAMNLLGIAMGMNMSPGFNCDPENTGINSLPLVRLCTEQCRTADEVIAKMKKTPRGVSWNYIVADGRNGRSCVVEAGASGASEAASRFVEIPPEDYHPFLPDADFIEMNKTAEYGNGMMIRWNDYKYPTKYLEYNYELWDYFNKKHKSNKGIYSDALTGEGFINKQKDERNCPSSYYFAPQREESDDILIATNHFIIPEMRYFAMHRWTAKVISDRVDDIQWRYDELNSLIREALIEKGYIGFDKARELTSFLSPNGRNPGYYADNPRSRDGKEIRIEGAGTVFDLKNMIVSSHYGYYCDEWVSISLKKYFP